MFRLGKYILVMFGFSTYRWLLLDEYNGIEDDLKLIYILRNCLPLILTGEN